MMHVYFDTGFVAKLYCLEDDSADAVRTLRRYPPPYPATHFLDLELKTALRLKLFRGELSPVELHAALHNWAQDRENGVWLTPSYSLPGVFQVAEDLSAQRAATIGCRTLDILHVAAALAIGATDFVTWDDRQASLARKTGLRVHR